MTTWQVIARDATRSYVLLDTTDRWEADKEYRNRATQLRNGSLAPEITTIALHRVTNGRRKKVPTKFISITQEETA